MARTTPDDTEALVAKAMKKPSAKVLKLIVEKAQVRSEENRDGR